MRAVEHLTGLRPRIVSLSPHRLIDVWEDVLRVGQALERRAQAELLVKSYRQQLMSLQDSTANLGNKPRVAVLEWLYPLLASRNWTPELGAYAAGENVFVEVVQHSPWLRLEAVQA